MQYKDYYQTLGVSKTASQDEIRKAFRKLARVHHPDMAKAKDKVTAESKFKEINEAYEVLGEPDKRRQYDELGSNWQAGAGAGRGGFRRAGGAGGGGGFRGAPGGDPFGGAQFGGTGFSDFFEQFFGAARAGGARGGARPGADPFAGMGGFPQQDAGGADIEADLLVTIEEALHGAKKKISFRREGSSKVETYEVGVPKGVRGGQRIRLAGQGESAGPHGGRAGDLFLRVKFAQHPDYRIAGADLIHDLELPVAKAVLGTEVEIPTPDGSVRLKIPPGTQPGRKMRLKGRGLPNGPGTRGDYLVEIDVAVPKTLTDEQRTLWEKLAALNG